MNGYKKRSEKKREAILCSALELFLEKGPNQTSMSHIAEKAGVSQVTIYNYFESKENLLRQVLLNHLMPSIHKMRELIYGPLPFKEKFHELMRIRAHDPLAASLQTKDWNHPLVAELLSQLGREHSIPLTFELFERGKQEGALDPSIPVEAVIAFLEALLPLVAEGSVFRRSPDFYAGLHRLVLYGVFGKEV